MKRAQFTVNEKEYALIKHHALDSGLSIAQFLKISAQEKINNQTALKDIHNVMKEIQIRNDEARSDMLKDVQVMFDLLKEENNEVMQRNGKMLAQFLELLNRQLALTPAKIETFKDNSILNDPRLRS